MACTRGNPSPEVVSDENEALRRGANKLVRAFSAAFGPSPILVLGPDSALGPMIAVVILPLAAGDVELAAALAGMLALMVGLVNVGAGVATLGFVADLIPKPVRIGYLAGLAIAISAGRVPKLFGFSVEGNTSSKRRRRSWRTSMKPIIGR